MSGPEGRHVPATDAAPPVADIGLIRVRRLGRRPGRRHDPAGAGRSGRSSRAGESVVAGAPIAERLRDARLSEVVVAAARPHPEPGGRVADGRAAVRVARPLARGRRRGHRAGRDARRGHRPRGPTRERRSSSARPAARCAASSRWAGRPAAASHVAAGGEGELRGAAASTSGWPGAILVVGSRIDAETLTRARAMGVRGIIVAGLASKERRDFLASETRQRAALHRLPPFAVLVLEGAIRRPLASPVMDILEALDGPRRRDRRPTRRR